jgi:hypothetical protein
LQIRDRDFVGQDLVVRLARKAALAEDTSNIGIRSRGYHWFSSAPIAMRLPIEVNRKFHFFAADFSDAYFLSLSTVESILQPVKLGVIQFSLEKID